MATDADAKPPPLMGATAIRPPDRVGMDRYTHIFWDPKNGTVLTRTPKSWALIILFYCIYYSCLAGFWIAAMSIFLKIQIQDPRPAAKIPDAKPTWTLKDSIIGVNPGVGVRPSQPEEHVNSGIFTLDLKFDGSEPSDKYTEKEGRKIEGSKGYAYRARDFFAVYKTNQDESKDGGDGTGDGVICNNPKQLKNGKYRKGYDTFCLFDRTTLGSCDRFPYGYGNKTFKPCVFLKFNRIMDLEPKPINADSDTKDLTDKTFLAELLKLSYPKEVFVKCEGEYPADKEALEDGGLKMYPETDGLTNAAGIPLKYFPYSKYRVGKNESPLVAVQFSNLEKVKGRIIHIICKAYYDGVVHSKKNKAGLVKFEMYLN